MSILERTENLQLHKFTGSPSKAALYDIYTTDMEAIDIGFAALDETVTEAAEVVQTYNVRLETLEQCCSDVNATLLNYGSRLNAIEQVIATVSTANIDALTERVNALENKVDTNTTNIDIVRNDIKELEERVEVIEDTLVTDAALITNNTNRISILETCCDSVRATLAEYDTRITQNTADIRALEDRVTADEGNIAANAQDITILSNQTRQNTEDIQDLKDAFSELDPTSALEVVRQVSINTTNISNLQTSVNAQAQNLTALTTRVGNDESVISSQGSAITQLQEDIASVQDWESRIDAVEQTAADMTAEVSALSNEVTGLSGDVAAMDSRVTTNASDIDALDGRLTTVESKQATDESNFTALETRVAANEADLVAVHQTITNDETGLANVSSRVTALETLAGDTPLTTVAQTLSGGVVEVDTKVTNADSKATQALSLANTADTNATQAIADAAQASSDAAQASTDAAQAISDAADVASDVGDLSQLTTTDKTSVVDAINEVNAKNPLAWTLLGTANGTNSVNFGKALSAFNDLSFVIHNNTSSGGNDLYTITVPAMSLSANKIVYGSGGATCSNGIRANIQIGSDAQSAHISTVWHQGNQIQANSSLYVYGR